MSNLVDRSKLILFIKNDLMCDHEIFTTLVEKLTLNFNDLQAFRLTAPENLKDLGLLAHRLKSGCRSFAAVGLVQEILAIEDAAKTENQAAALQHLQAAVNLIEPTLTEIQDIYTTEFRTLSISATKS